MSDIARGLHQYLQTVTAVTDICGDRGYPDVAVENPLRPFYTYNLVSYDPVYTVDDNTFSQAIIEVDCIADDRDTAEALREAIRVAISNYRGAWGSETVRGCTIQSKFDDYEIPIMGEQFGWYIHSLDFLVSYLES